LAVSRGMGRKSVTGVRERRARKPGVRETRARKPGVREARAGNPE